MSPTAVTPPSPSAYITPKQEISRKTLQIKSAPPKMMSARSPARRHASAIVVTTASVRLDIWIDRLAKKESNGRERIKVLDKKGKYSYGCLQFQEAIFKTEMKHHKLIPLSSDAAIMDHIYDCQIQKQLAKAMIQENYNNWRHWKFTAMTKVGLPPR